MIPGIDVSDNNGPLDNPILVTYLLSKNPDAFAVVKVSESTNYVSQTLDQQRLGLHAAGLRWIGLYHFGRPSANTGHDEAEFFNSTIGAHGGIMRGEFMVLDLEDDRVAPDADLGAYVADFRSTLERALGFQLVVYSRDEYLRAHRVTVDPKDYWCASWDGIRPNAALWQFAEGSTPGVFGPVDLDFLLAPIDVFAARHCWGFQPDPVAGRPAVGTPDLPSSTDVPTTIKHSIELLKRPNPDVSTVIADLSQALVNGFGLIGA